MIDLGIPARQIDGLTFLAGVEPGSWYVLPAHPQLLRMHDGTPDFSLVKFRDFDTDRMGGVLRLAVDLSVPSSRLDSAAAQLRGKDGSTPAITPLPAVAVRSDLIGWTGDDTHNASPSDLSKEPPFAARFKVMLSKEAATLYEAALEVGQAPAVIIYWLACKARRPAVDARLQIDGRRAAQYVSEQFGSGPLRYGQIVDAIPALMQHGAIRLDVLSADDSLATAARVQGVLERILLTDLFAAHGADVGELPASLSPEQLAFRTRNYKLKDGAATVQHDLAAPAEVTTTFACAVAVAQLVLPLGDVRAFITHIEGLPS